MVAKYIACIAIIITSMTHGMGTQEKQSKPSPKTKTSSSATQHTSQKTKASIRLISNLVFSNGNPPQSPNARTFYHD